MKMHRFAAPGLLACAALSPLPAAAQVQSDVTASNLRFVLVDLTPDDGETPWFTFTDADLSPVSASTSATPTAGSEQRARQYVERLGYFTFSPNTRVSLALDVDMAMRAGPLPEPEQGGAVWAAILAGATWGPPKDMWERRDSEDVYGNVGFYYGDYTTRYDRDQTLWLGFENDSAYAAWGEFRIILESSSYALASPVPEPSAPAMLALGACLLGMLGRRRPSAPFRGVGFFTMKS